jgi:hypothetical protein
MAKADAVTKKTYPLTGLFETGAAAERAYRACVDRGYEVGEVNVIVSEGTRKKLLSTEDEIKAELAERKAEGGELGGPTGGRVGLLVTVFAAVGAAVAVPAIGFAAGPVAVALAAAGAAGVAGGLIAVAGDWGIPKERVKAYEAAIKRGAILMRVAARTPEDARAIAKEWERFGARELHSA